MRIRVTPEMRELIEVYAARIYGAKIDDEEWAGLCGPAGGRGAAHSIDGAGR